MAAMIVAFWHYLAWVNALSPAHQCVAVTQSTHSTPATHFGIVYGGNCAQAFRTALASAGSIAWEIVG